MIDMRDNREVPDAVRIVIVCMCRGWAQTYSLSDGFVQPDYSILIFLDDATRFKRSCGKTPSLCKLCRVGKTPGDSKKPTMLRFTGFVWKQR